MLKNKLRSLFYFPYDERYRSQMELEMVARNYRSERVIAYVMLVLQLFMVSVFASRTGGIFYSSRRLCYVISYSSLALSLLILLSVHKRSRDNWRLHTASCTVFAVILCLWTCSISYLDALGGLSIIVYCSLLPMMSAFLTLPPYVMSVLFILTCTLTDILVLQTPYGQKNLFSTLINSIFVCLLSVVYGTRMYHARLAGIYDKMIIAQKNEQLKKANEELDRLSMTDTLTTLGNRRYLDTMIRIPLEKYGVHMGPVSLVLLDIDYFKQYNDRYGHPQGDLCLRKVAAVLSEAAEEHSYAVRYGGEEFLLVMFAQTAQRTYETAEKIRTTIEELKIPYEQSKGNVISTSVTVSIGISYHPAWRQGLWETAVSEADQALYAAKYPGRSRTVMQTHELNRP